MKVVPFFPNNPDNLHCLQSCVQSVLSYYDIVYDPNEVDKKTGFFGTMSWTPHSVNWLNEKGLRISLNSPFKYDLLVSQGEGYLKSFKGSKIFQKEKNEGQYKHLDKIKEASKKMIDSNLWVDHRMEISEIRDFLSEDGNLIIAKTVHEFLSGNYVAGTSHFVVAIKEYKYGEWLIHDPGLPPIERRKVKQTIGNGHSIFGDVIVISRK